MGRPGSGIGWSCTNQDWQSSIFHTSSRCRADPNTHTSHRHPDTPTQRYSSGIKHTHADRGGRLYCTAMAAMILEVYYRYLPIYREQSIEEDFPE